MAKRCHGGLTGARLVPAAASPYSRPVEYHPSLPIDTNRLRLRPFTRGDVEAVFAYRSREDVTRFLYDDPMSREAVAEAIQARVGHDHFSDEGDKIMLAVERRADGAMMGEASLILRSTQSRQVEIGYIFHPDYHGHGYATETAQALLAMAFSGAGAHRVYARCHAHNEASRRVMERIGMQAEAHFREHQFTKGRWDEEIVCAILESAWPPA
jgi:RimJ/RimL family protein N-acetyltransferase